MNIRLFTIPNLITCGNLLCGCFGILAACNAHLVAASWWIVGAMVCDFLDGFVARLLHSSSPIGKDLDSLADVVTFGVLPGIMLWQLFKELPNTNTLNSYLAYTSFLVPLCSALRLAKFNNDPRQNDSFIGVPTPANALLVASLPLIAHADRWQNVRSYLFSTPTLLLLSVGMSALLLAELPLFSLKFKSFKLQDNLLRYGFLATSVLLFILLNYLAIPFIILLYLVVSIVHLFTKLN